MKKILKMTAIIIGSAIGFLLLAGIVWLNSSPQFGASQLQSDKLRYAQSKNYQDGTFKNQISNCKLP